jgi:hypothetical protein
MVGAIISCLMKEGIRCSCSKDRETRYAYQIFIGNSSWKIPPLKSSRSYALKLIVEKWVLLEEFVNRTLSRQWRTVVYHDSKMWAYFVQVNITCHWNIPQNKVNVFIVFRSVKHHKCSNIHLFLTYPTRFGRHKKRR